MQLVLANESIWRYIHKTLASSSVWSTVIKSKLLPLMRKTSDGNNWLIYKIVLESNTNVSPGT